jgi:flagellar secretion chaperone FliS
MSSDALRARYMGDTVTTANPARLLVMLYDRLALDLERAEEALKVQNREEASSQLQHAQDIVIELRSSLDVTVWDGGPGLASLYGWLISELIAANVSQSLARVVSCRQIVEPLRTAWHEAALVTAGKA